jgi:hypothetical protein
MATRTHKIMVCSACGAKEGSKGWDSVSCSMYAREVKDVDNVREMRGYGKRGNRRARRALLPRLPRLRGQARE